MFKKFRAYLAQREHTAKHRSMERADGFRLMSLTDHPVPSYNGYRPWCDTVLRDCYLCGTCCACAHTERAPAR